MKPKSAKGTTLVSKSEAARTKVWRDKKQIYDEIKVLLKKSKRWLMREMAQAKKDVEAATAAQLDPATPPLVITHKILIVNNAIRASHSIKVYFDAIVKRFNKAEAESNAEHEKLYNKPMKEVIAKRQAAAKAEEDEGPTWTNDFIEGLGKNATSAIAKAEESREFMANITGEDYVKPTNIMGASGESGASGASGAEAGSESGAAAQEMRFSQIFASGPGSPKNASAKNSSSSNSTNGTNATASAADGSRLSKLEALLQKVAAKVLSGGAANGTSSNSTNKTVVTPPVANKTANSSSSKSDNEMGEPASVSHTFTTPDGKTITTMTTFHKSGEASKKKKALWQKVKAIEEKKAAASSGPSGASGSAATPDASGSSGCGGSSGCSGSSGASGAGSGPSEDTIARL